MGAVLPERWDGLPQTKSRSPPITSEMCFCLRQPIHGRSTARSNALSIFMLFFIIVRIFLHGVYFA